MREQDKINDIQETYKAWLSTQSRLTEALTLLEESNHLMAKLNHFYFDGEWRELFEKIEAGLTVDLSTEGECSVMSEDTLWNAFHEQEALLWAFLRTATKALDKNQPNFYSENYGA